MKVHNVHTRNLAAPAQEVGDMLDALGGPQDRLWPQADRWPTDQLELDWPLTVGAPARHDGVCYRIAEYEPGRRLIFRFDPGFGLIGTHGFTVEELHTNLSRLSHTLACTVEPKLLPLWPLVRRQHDALMEDLLDRAELAVTGQVAQPAQWPWPVRVADRVGRVRARVRDRRRVREQGQPSREAPPSIRPGGPAVSWAARLGGTAVPAALAALSVVHVAWALGWRWPGSDDREFAERVIGYGATGPTPDWATWSVAFALAGAAATVRTTAIKGPAAPSQLRQATLAVALILLARGAISIPLDLVRGLDDIYERLDITIYSPLCLLLGAGATAVARRGRARPSPPKSETFLSTRPVPTR